MKVYHYTQSFRLDIILEAGFIKLESFLPSIPDLVWLTSEEFVPNTARPQNQHADPPRFFDVFKYHRFVFDSSNPLIKPWTTYQKTFEEKRVVTALNKTAKDLKDKPESWYVSEEPLPIEEYEKATANPDVNVFIGGEWV